MDREDFLEILRDYLKDGLRQSEVDNIVRGYEEKFIKNRLEGISDEKTIRVMGSPKNIALEEIENRKNDELKSSAYKKKDNWFKKLFVNIRLRVHRKHSRKSKRKDGMLSADAIISGRISEKKVKKVMNAAAFLFWIALIPSILLVTLGIIFVIGFTAANVIACAGAFYLFSYRLSLGFFLMFVSITWAGVSILLWLMMILLVKLIIGAVQKYISWSKDKKMYISIREEYGSPDSSDFINGILLRNTEESFTEDGGDDYEKQD